MRRRVTREAIPLALLLGAVLLGFHFATGLRFTWWTPAACATAALVTAALPMPGRSRLPGLHLRSVLVAGGSAASAQVAWVWSEVGWWEHLTWLSLSFPTRLQVLGYYCALLLGSSLALLSAVQYGRSATARRSAGGTQAGTQAEVRASWTP